MDRVNVVSKQVLGPSYASSASTSSPSAQKLAGKKVMVANRGEIACRIFRACKSLGIKTVAVYTVEDEDANHRHEADEAFLLPVAAGAKGPDPVGPYLNVDLVLSVAKKCKADAIHPGYGFLSENSEFCRKCAEQKVIFIGPTGDQIDLFGDKTSSRDFAIKQDVSVAIGSSILKDVNDAKAFIEDGMKNKGLKFPLLLKAANGGGGKGQRILKKIEELEDGFKKCSQEAFLSFGKPELFVEEYVENARHIEIQVLCDTYGNQIHIFERDCSLQLRNQKVLEIAPARGICKELREKLTGAALRLCQGSKYVNAGTVEFLVRGKLDDPESRYIFLEVNPRIQVEHTITEEITGLTLVENQIRIAFGENLKDIIPGSEKSLQDRIKFTGGAKSFAAQLRICLTPGNHAKNFTKWKQPEGCRVDTGVREGGPICAAYDSMIAKLIVTGSTFPELTQKCLKSLEDFGIEGASVNKDQLKKILEHDAFADNEIFTTFLQSGALNKKSKKKGGKAKKEKVKLEPKWETKEVLSPLPGAVAEVNVKEGDTIEKGQVLCVVSAMKLLNDVCSDYTGKVLKVMIKQDQQVQADDVLISMSADVNAVDDDDEDEDQAQAASGKRGAASQMGGGGGSSSSYAPMFKLKDKTEEETDYNLSSAIIASKAAKQKNTPAYKKRLEINNQRIKELNEKLEVVYQYGGEKYVKRARKKGKYLARERIQKIIDPGTRFMELSPLAAWEIEGGKNHSAAIITGIGQVHGREVMFLANDSTINGGAYSQTTMKKAKRAQEIAEINHLPCMYLADGGGANLSADGQGKQSSVSFVWGGLMFKNQAVMSSKQIPQIGCAFGNCTAGAAYTCAMCDELIMVKNNGTIYLGGPPLVKAATGEDANEQELGGAQMHCSKSGVADHYVENEDEAFVKLRATVEHLGPKRGCPLQLSLPADEPIYPAEELYGIIPEDNKIPFEVREVIARVVDGSRFNEFKPKYGPTLVCGWAHIHGFPVGIVANNGMLFSETAIKATHFIQICGQRGTPLLFMHNITGFIIGTAYEQGGITKDGAKMVMAVSCAPVPKLCLVLAGSHGAGNYAMCGPAFDPRFTFLWPNAKISVMGGEQAAGVIVSVKNNQLKKQGQPELPKEFVDQMKQPIIDAVDKTATAYHSTREIYDDGIIDPKDTRDVLGMSLAACMNGPTADARGAAERPRYGVFR